MRNILIILVTILFSNGLLAQDTIYLRKGEILNIKILKSTPEFVEFTFPNESLINTEYKNAITKIIYSSGRTEICQNQNKLAVIRGEEDWDKVIVTYLPSDVIGLTKICDITAKGNWGGAFASGLGYKKAIEKLKIQAAKNLASIVLITDKPNESSMNMGGVRLVGVCYK